MIVERDQPMKQRQALLLLSERRQRNFPIVMALGLLAIPFVFVTVAMPLLWPVDLWFVIAMDVTFVAIFILWRAYVGIGDWINATRTRPNIKRLLAGETLIHWTYSADELQRFAEQEYRRDRRISGAFMPFWTTFFGSLIFAVMVGGVMLLVNSSESSSGSSGGAIPGEAVALAAAVAFAIPFFYMAFQWITMFLGDRKVAAERRNTLEIRLNASGLLGAPGGYIPLDPEKLTFSVAVEDGMPLLLVKWEQALTGRMFNLTVNKVERVLIPRGREEEAQALAAKHSSH